MYVDCACLQNEIINQNGFHQNLMMLVYPKGLIYVMHHCCIIHDEFLENHASENCHNRINMYMQPIRWRVTRVLLLSEAVATLAVLRFQNIRATLICAAINRFGTSNSFR